LPKKIPHIGDLSVTKRNLETELVWSILFSYHKTVNTV